MAVGLNVCGFADHKKTVGGHLSVGGSCVCHCGPVVLATVLAMMVVLFNEFGGVFVPCASLCERVVPVLLCTVIECMLAQHNLLPATVSEAFCFRDQQVKLACDGGCVRSVLYTG